MKTFLAIYLGTHEATQRSGWMQLSESERQSRQLRGVAAWKEWGTANASTIVEHGGPLGKTKRVSKDGITDTHNAMTGYVVVRAESHAAAAHLFDNHPHFSVLPGDSVEIMEVLPMPAG
jgi:hypothetical protein